MSIRELIRTSCKCGGAKMRGEPFCKECWHELPRSLRKRLEERKDLDAFRAAYGDAVGLLADFGRFQHDNWKDLPR